MQLINSIYMCITDYYTYYMLYYKVICTKYKEASYKLYKKQQINFV